MTGFSTSRRFSHSQINNWLRKEIKLDVIVKVATLSFLYMGPTERTNERERKRRKNKKELRECTHGSFLKMSESNRGCHHHLYLFSGGPFKLLNVTKIIVVFFHDETVPTVTLQTPEQKKNPQKVKHSFTRSQEQEYRET